MKKCIVYRDSDTLYADSEQTQYIGVTSYNLEEVETTLSIMDLGRLKEKGFSADDIIGLHKAGVI